MLEAETFGVAVLVLNGLGAPGVAAALHRRWASGRGLDYLHVYAGVLLLVALWGAAILDPKRLVGPPMAWLLALPVGGLAGYMATRADRVVIRLLAKHRAAVRTREGAERPAAPEQPRVIRFEAVTLFDDEEPVPPSPAPPPKRTQSHQVGAQGFDLPALLLVGGLEEVVFRGWLVQACLALPGSGLQAAAVGLTVLAFAMLHLQFGWEHVLAKVPLGGLALAAALLSGSIAAAVVAHVWFNSAVWRDQQRLSGS